MHSVIIPLVKKFFWLQIVKHKNELVLYYALEPDGERSVANVHVLWYDIVNKQVCIWPFNISCDDVSIIPIPVLDNVYCLEPTTSHHLSSRPFPALLPSASSLSSSSSRYSTNDNNDINENTDHDDNDGVNKCSNENDDGVNNEGYRDVIQRMLAVHMNEPEQKINEDAAYPKCNENVIFIRKVDHALNFIHYDEDILNIFVENTFRTHSCEFEKVDYANKLKLSRRPPPGIYKITVSCFTFLLIVSPKKYAEHLKNNKDKYCGHYSHSLYDVFIDKSNKYLEANLTRVKSNIPCLVCKIISRINCEHDILCYPKLANLLMTN